jgi:5-methylcytosine-specific restriction endonuclease McrA
VKSKSVPNAVRRVVAVRYGKPTRERLQFPCACVYCGAKGTVTWFWLHHSQRISQWVYFDLQLDHVIPLALGGTHDPQNIVPACRSCNAAKKDHADWRRHAEAIDR